MLAQSRKGDVAKGHGCFPPPPPRSPPVQMFTLKWVLWRDQFQIASSSEQGCLTVDFDVDLVAKRVSKQWKGRESEIHDSTAIKTEMDLSRFSAALISQLSGFSFFPKANGLFQPSAECLRCGF